MAVLAAKIEAAQARVSDADLPKGASWAGQARKKALGTLWAGGLPHKRDEYWKFTDPARLAAAETPTADVLPIDEKPVFYAVDRHRMVFVDGVLDTDISHPLKMDNVEIETLQQATGKDIHWARDLFGVLENNGQSPVQRPLAALNTATAKEGLVIRVTGKAQKPICLSNIRQEARTDAVIHHVIRLEEGAELTLLENGPSAARLNLVLEIELADGAVFNHVRTQGRDHQRVAANHMFVRLGRESRFKSFTLTANGTLTRSEAVIEMTGDDAHATISGASVGDGDFHHDDTVFLTHNAVNCESRQVFKKVLRNGATGVFQGKILVKADAQKTDGYQISQGLLLDDDSQFLAKPELEIYADDVICSHGSTCGAVDETALFYLTSRGVPKAVAQDMLVLAFLSEAIDEIEDSELAEDIRHRLEEWMQRHRT